MHAQAPPEEVFDASTPDAVNAAIAEHNRKVTAFFADVLPATMTAQQRAVAQYETATSTQEMRDKAYKVVLAQAWALSRLRPDQLQYIARLGTDARKFTTTDAAVELARTYRDIPDPAHADR
ncbi:MAG: hypothetical protein JSV65_19905 [Armatimonadota bacterium]|nr:MAG: hypothetical protein JSV65_19905 [Armatimonadota bacterium]